MNVITSLPRPIRTIEHCWIPLSDGIRLAARIWLPEDADRTPVPAVFEFIPYRKRDFYRTVDETIHPYFAGHGIAVVRVDLRGSGESEGVLLDEYLPGEQDDALEVIDWIAHQSWCTGKIGMMGISWGGFNSLQVAARRPPALKAIITVDSTDDRYADDIHYMGGCLLNDNFAWSAQMFVRNGRPPDPALVGDRWRDMWLERLENTPPYIANWLSHQRRDAYWRHGSVCEDYGAIEAAVWAIGGWADGYTNSVPRLLAGLKSPATGLVGPWPHDYPHTATPGPRLDFLREAVLWWERWLKDIPNEVDNWPAYRVYLQDSVPPRHFYAERPGRWLAEPRWPSPHVRNRIFSLAPGRLTEDPGETAELRLCSPLTTGLAFGRWCPYGGGPEMPGDQRADDARSLAFESEPLREPLALLGAPRLTVDVASNRPVAMIAARLVDVAPDGQATLISYGLLNLCHRRGHDRVDSLPIGRPEPAVITLNHCGYILPAGHRLRLSLSTIYWPIAWPSPELVTLTIFTERAILELPERPLDIVRAAPPIAEPQVLPGLDRSVLRPGGYSRRILEDQVSGETTVDVAKDLGHWVIHEADLVCDGLTDERYVIRADDPLSARVEVTANNSMARGSWRALTATRTVARATRSHFILDLDLDAHEGDRRIFHRSWHVEVPRDGV
ncbi:MAG: uncharacterized protein QOK29_2767 [Rhodospirillaceae bacterium]|nr:uncharacterized protein [Rhodospirillaceae bacterium]